MILMIYGKEVYKEYLLPNLINLDYSIELERELFSLDEDITLMLENIEGKWFIKNDGVYIKSTSDENVQPVEDKSVITVRTGNEILNIIAVDTNVSYCIPIKYNVSQINEITIGNNEACTIEYSFMEYVSSYHCKLYRNGNGWYAEDRSKNGLFINYRRVHSVSQIRLGDIISIFGINIIYLGSWIGISSRYGNLCVHGMEAAVFNGYETPVRNKKSTKIIFNRSPRNIPIIYEDEINIEEPPAAKNTKHPSVIQQIGPSFTMAIPMLLGCGMSIYGSKASGMSSGAFMYTGIITALGSAILGSVWGILNLRYNKKQEIEEEQIRFDSYGNYLMRISDEIKKKYEINTAALNTMYPSASECSSFNINTSRLWNRNISHEDFLFVRLGLGDIPFQVKIKVPQKKFSMTMDRLKEKPAYISEEYKTLRNVPVGIDVSKSRLWGIAGGINKLGAYNIMYDIVANFAANNCYTDVKMVFIYDSTGEDSERWNFLRWLPHVWSENKHTRYIAGDYNDRTDIFHELASVFRVRMEESNSSVSGRKTIQKPYYLMFVEDPSLLEGEIISRYVFSDNENLGLSTFLLTDKCENLPNTCENIIENDGVFAGVYNAMDYHTDKQKINFDVISDEQMKNLIFSIADLQVNEVENDKDIPTSLDFFSMYGVDRLEDFNVAQRWRKNRSFNSMRALIGKKSGNADCYLDIHEKFHGPHGLIAGTTGSGKSETLQTYMLSLALNYSPEDIGFFIIDFKGGGMANLFSDLPHLVGQISNLSGNQVRRAMISIKSENMRRQRAFNECGVNNINQYTKLYKNNETSMPIPHLFIIIDEFAELKREEPEFMRELISVAQVGRSLGVHLILATQKPSGTVDDNIWSNTKFRLCLRVQDKQDSNDMLHKPDAAYITQAGRCYLQVGNDEIYELFQSGWSGAIYDPNMSDSKAELATMLNISGRTALVGSKAKLRRREAEKHNSLVKLISFVKEVIGCSDGELTSTEEIARRTLSLAMDNGCDFGLSQADIVNMTNFIDGAENFNADTEEICAKVYEKNIKIPEIKEKTQLDAVVEYLKELSDKNGFSNIMQLWLPVLPQNMCLAQLHEFEQDCYETGSWEKPQPKWNLEVPVGFYDDPVNQAQAAMVMNFSQNGHYAVCGMIVSGKSTFLQTMLYSLASRYSPDYVNMYILDFSSHMLEPFEQLPHCGGVVFDKDLDKIGKFFNMISCEMESRAKLFGGGNYSQYVAAYGVKLPAIIVVIDNFANFREKTEDKYEDLIIRLSRDGVGYGIFLVISAGGFGMAEIPSRVADNIKSVVCLELGDKFKYMELLRTSSIPVMPETDVHGRGLCYVGDRILEFQTCLCEQADDDYARSKMIALKCSEMKSAWKGRNAPEIPYIPENPVLGDIVGLEQYISLSNDKSKLPYAYTLEDASVAAVNLRFTYCFAVTGKSNIGKKNTLKMIMKAAAEKSGKIIVIEINDGKLKKYANKYADKYITDAQGVFEFGNDITPMFVSRNKQKNTMLANGNTEDEIFEKQSLEQPYFVFISDMQKFVETIYTPGGNLQPMNGFFENIFEKGFLHNIYFFASVNTDSSFTLGGKAAFANFTRYKSGIHLGGNVSSQRIFSFANIPYADQNKQMKKGIGYMADSEDDSVAHTVVIPFAGRDTD